MNREIAEDNCRAIPPETIIVVGPRDIAASNLNGNWMYVVLRAYRNAHIFVQNFVAEIQYGGPIRIKALTLRLKTEPSLPLETWG